MLVSQVRWLVYLPGSTIGFTGNVLARNGCKIFLVELPGSRICRSILRMVFKALHKSGTAAGLEEKARFRVVMGLTTCWQRSGLWQAGKGRQICPVVVQLLLAWSWPAVGEAQHRLFQHTLSTCKQFHHLNLLPKSQQRKGKKSLEESLPALVVFTSYVGFLEPDVWCILIFFNVSNPCACERKVR